MHMRSQNDIHKFEERVFGRMEETYIYNSRLTRARVDR